MSEARHAPEGLACDTTERITRLEVELAQLRETVQRLCAELGVAQNAPWRNSQAAYQRPARSAAFLRQWSADHQHIDTFVLLPDPVSRHGRGIANLRQSQASAVPQ